MSKRYKVCILRPGLSEINFWVDSLGNYVRGSYITDKINMDAKSIKIGNKDYNMLLLPVKSVSAKVDEPVIKPEEESSEILTG